MHQYADAAELPSLSPFSDRVDVEREEDVHEALLAPEETSARPPSLYARLRKTMWLTAAGICFSTLLLLIILEALPARHHFHPRPPPRLPVPTIIGAKKSGSFRAGGDRADKAVVLASFKGQDISWTKDIPDDWTIYHYTLPGREALPYLSFIAANYFSLPDYTIFLHGHARSWHQVEPAAWKIRALNLTALDREGYINLRCKHDSGCTKDTLLGNQHQMPEFEPLRNMVGNMTIKFWNKMLKPYGFGRFPDEIGGPCCAQFAVTRSAIQTRSVDFYFNYMKPLKEPVEVGQEKFGPRWNEYRAGALYEYMWHHVFGRPALDCPPEDKCRTDFFSGAIGCNEYPGRFQKSWGWEKTTTCRNNWQVEDHTDSQQREET